MAAVSAAAIALLSAGLAWGCTREAGIQLQPAVGAPGSQATVSGSSFVDSRVDIRWGSASGPPIGSAQPSGGSFTTSVTIPNVAPGAYYVVAVVQDEDGNVFTPSQPFEVTAPAATTGGGQGSGDDSGTRRGSEPSGGSAGDTRGGAPSARSGARRDRSAAQAPGRDPRAQGGDSAVATDRSGRAVFSDSVARSDAKGRAKPSASQRTAAADLWNGFSSDGSPLLASSDSAEPASNGGLGAAAIAVPLVLLGLGTLLAGALVAGRRGRRARAPTARG